MQSIEEMQSIYAQINESLDKLAIHLSGCASLITTSELADKAEIVLILREFKDMLKDGTKLINKIADKCEEHLCTIIVNQELIPYRHPKATISPAVTGYFHIKDAKGFLDYLEGDLDKFLQFATSKKDIREFCEKILEEGKNLPSAIKEHIIAKVSIRRNKNA